MNNMVFETNIFEKFPDKTQTYKVKNKTVDLLFMQYQRDYQQDSYLIKEFDNGILFAIADGMGGHENGDLASQETIDILEQKFTDPSPEKVLPLIEEIDRVISAHGDDRGTTLTFFFLEEDKLTYYHIGDSYLKIFPKEFPKEKQIFGSAPQESRDGALTNVIGFLIPSLISHYTMPLKGDEIIALYTDGFWGFDFSLLARQYWEIDLTTGDFFLNGDNKTMILIK